MKVGLGKAAMKIMITMIFRPPLMQVLHLYKTYMTDYFSTLLYILLELQEAAAEKRLISRIDLKKLKSGMQKHDSKRFYNFE